MDTTPQYIESANTSIAGVSYLAQGREGDGFSRQGVKNGSGEAEKKRMHFSLRPSAATPFRDKVGETQLDKAERTFH